MSKLPNPDEMAEFEQGYDLIAPKFLRDWFAGMAMQSLVIQKYVQNEAGRDEVATIAYDVADAMIKARKKPGA